MTAPLILASASPRRRELLAEAGIDLIVDASDVPEIPQPGESPARFAQRVARDKATEVAKRHPRQFVLAADTVVALGDSIFGKPSDRDDARRMLEALSGRTHAVITGVALIDADGTIDEILVETRVDFSALHTTDIESYLDTGEPFDKAGAYAVQGIGGKFVVAVHGSRSNVIGLPMEATTALLQRKGFLSLEERRP